MGVIEETVRQAQINNNRFFFKYSEMVDRESAYEQLEERVARQQAEKQREEEELAAQKTRPADGRDRDRLLPLDGAG